MRTRRNKVIGVAAAVLAVTACGIAVGNSGETSAGHPAAASAGHAPAATPVTDQEMLAQIKRHLMQPAGDPAAQRSATPVTDQEMLPQIKRDVVLHAGQQALGR